VSTKPGQLQIAYLPVYATWAALVVLVFPLVFGFRWGHARGIAHSRRLQSLLQWWREPALSDAGRSLGRDPARGSRATGPLHN